jgi:hypothetical protein
MSAKQPEQTCPKMTEVIGSGTTRKFEISLSGDQPRLSRGANTFCIKFRSFQTGEQADPRDVKAEATMSTGRTRLLRAVVRVYRLDVGHYCAHVNLPLPGYWLITVKHGGSHGSGKITFLETIG